MAQMKKKPTISLEAMEMLEMILRPSHPAPDKTTEQLQWDECKRYIMNCIHAQIVVIS